MEIRKLGSELSAYHANIPFYKFIHKKHIEEIVRSLTGISNSFIINNSQEYIYEYIDEYEKPIKKYFKIKF